MKLAPAAPAVVLALLVAAGAAVRAQQAAPGCPDPSKCPVNIRAEEVKWQKIFPELGPDGPEIAILRVDPKTQATQLMIRSIKAGYVPWHWHSANETHTILSGVFTAECEGKRAELGVGSFNFIPARMVHRAWMSDACTLFITVDAAWDLHWVEGPPRPPKPGDPPPPKPGDPTVFDPDECRFDGLVIDAIEVAEAPGRTPSPRSGKTADKAQIARILKQLAPRETKPSGGTNRWIVTLHAGDGGYVHTIWVFDYGEWGYGGASRGVAADLPTVLEEVVGAGKGPAKSER